MEKDKVIEEKLLLKGVKEYKIIRSLHKGLSYRVYNREVESKELLEERTVVLFKVKEGIAQFTVTLIESDQLIDNIIETCIKNAEKMSLHMQMDNFNDIKIEKNGNIEKFKSFNADEYVRWLEFELKKVSLKLNFSFNTVYELNIYKYCLRVNGTYIEQYYVNSEIFCIENLTFKCKAKLSNVFPRSKIWDIIIEKMNEVEFQTYTIDSFQGKRILIQSEGISQLLNLYVVLFYGNYVYTNQSYIKVEDIGKQIAQSKFNLVSEPYDGIVFDSEGTRTIKKDIIHSGKLINLLSNSATSEYLNLNSFGDSSLIDPNIISHQKLIFTFSEESAIKYDEIDFIIYKFKYINIDFNENKYKGIAVCKGQLGYFNTPVCFSIKDLFDNIYPIGTEKKWVNNVYCQDVMILT